MDLESSYEFVPPSAQDGEAVVPIDQDPSAVLPCRCKPRLPWQGSGDKLIGVVDMGSNGIRFSISDLSPPLARILPTVLVYRSPISLYDAQFDPDDNDKKVPIPGEVISSVCGVLNRFVLICGDLGVDVRRDIHVIATEALRQAINSSEFIDAVRANTGLSVELLPRDVEGQVGALGIASGFRSMEGLVMDLGGGSTQMSWMVSQGGHVRISPHGSFGFPYGAAALTRRLDELTRDKDEDEARAAVDKFRAEMVDEFRDAYHRMQVPDSMVDDARRRGGHRMYLSGGGFRGWGYLLLYLNQTRGKHYPISVINGYTVGREQFEDTKTVQEAADAAKDVFRVSDRRRSQVPAVAFLVNVLAQAIPHGIREAHFCQGGVREGYLFRQLEPPIRAQSPLEVATSGFAPESVQGLRSLLKFAIPSPSSSSASGASSKRRFPEDFGDHVLDAFVNTMYVLTFMSKETASTTALYSTSVGLISSAHGVSHQDRARLALMLESRYRGELPPRETEFREALRSLITPEEVWWAAYLGRVGYLITILYPAGKIDPVKPRVVFSSKWSSALGKKMNKSGLVLTISIQKKKHDPSQLKQGLKHNAKVIEKVGKKKRWIGKDDPWGMKVKVDVVEEGILEED